MAALGGSEPIDALLPIYIRYHAGYDVNLTIFLFTKINSSRLPGKETFKQIWSPQTILDP